MTKASETRKLQKEMVAQQKRIDEGELMHIQSQSDNWSECILQDGTKVRIRPVITEVRKLKKASIDGEPAYGIKSVLIADFQYPDKSKQGA